MIYIPHKRYNLMCLYNGRHSLFNWIFCPNFFQQCYLFLVAKQSSHQMCKWISIVSHISSFKPPVTLQLPHTMHLEKYRTCHLSWDIITKEKQGKHKKASTEFEEHPFLTSATVLVILWRLSCSLYPNMLWHWQPNNILFIYLFTYFVCDVNWHTETYCQLVHITAWWKTGISKMSTFQELKKLMFLSWSQSILEMLRRDVF